MVNTRTGVFDPYVTRVASDWDETAAGERWQSIDGSLVFVDISGFTNLSEKLARRGRIGAEELTSVLSRVFGNMLDVAYSCGGSLLKFGGDALLLMFDSPEHVMSAVGAAVEMRTALRESAKIPTSVGKIPLRMSVGVHTGPIDFFLVGGSHRELIITGPTASVTTDMEGTADAGEIVVSSAIKDAVPADYTGAAKGNGWILRKRSVPLWKCGPIVRHPISDEEMERFVPLGLRANLRSGLRESEHRIATVGFLKYKGIDAMMESGGPSQVAEALDELVQIVQRESDAEGVTFLATDIDADGGKIILVAGVPRSQEDDEGRVLRTARRILDARPQLAIRLGVNRGHVFSGDVGTALRSTYTIMGDTVNLAARLMAAANPGSLYASPGVIDRSTTMFRTEALEPFYVKGKEKPVQAFELFEETGTRPPDFSNELPFLGREPQMRVLREAMAAVEEGSDGRSITITGDTGIGKTRLLQELHSLTGGAHWFEVRGEPQGKDNTYFAFSDPLRRLLGIEPGSQAEMAAALDEAVLSEAPGLSPFAPLLADVAQIDMDDTPETADIAPRFRPDRTVDALAELLEEIFDGPTVLAFDDAHWLDEGSSSVVRKISAAAQDRPWLLVAAARAEGEGFEPIGSEMQLSPLERDDSRVIVVESTRSAPIRPAEVDNVVTRAGGNPLFLSEIIKAIRETGQASDLPDSLDSVVSSQIDQLPPLTKQVMRYSSVLGLSFRRVVLGELLAPEGLELDQATRRDLARYIEPAGNDRLRFLHAAVHDIAYQGLSYQRRRQLHARAGEVIERLAGQDPESVAEFLATHFSEGGEHKKAWRYAVIAGDRSRSGYANTEAAIQYRVACDAARRLDEIDPVEFARVYESLGDVCEMAGLFDEADSAYANARKLLSGDPQAQGRLMSKQGLIREKAGKLPVALSWFRRGLKAADDSPGDAQAELSVAYGGIRFRQGKFHHSIEWCQRVLADQGATDAQRAHALHLLVTAYAHIGSPKAVEAGEQAIEIYEQIGDLVGLGNVLNNLGVNAFYRGNWDESTDYHTRAGDARRQAGHVVGAAASVNNLAEIYCDQGKLAEAEQSFREALYVFESSEFPVGVALASANLGLTLTRLGKLAEAWTYLQSGRSMFEEMGAQAFIHETDVKIAEFHLMSRRWDQAKALAESALSSMELDESTLRARTGLHRMLGYCAVSAGLREEAEAEFAMSLDLAEEASAMFEQASTYQAMARTLRGHEKAAEWNEHQAEVFARLGVVATLVIPLA